MKSTVYENANIIILHQQNTNVFTVILHIGSSVFISGYNDWLSNIGVILTQLYKLQSKFQCASSVNIHKFSMINTTPYNKLHQ